MTLEAREFASVHDCICTWEILTGGELLMNRQRRSTLEPTNPDFPSSISTVWPFIPGTKIRNQLEFYLLNICEGTCQPLHVCSKLLTIGASCWADKLSWAVKGDPLQQRKRWAWVKGRGLEWVINIRDSIGHSSHWLIDPLKQIQSWDSPLHGSTRVTCFLVFGLRAGSTDGLESMFLSFVQKL